MKHNSKHQQGGCLCFSCRCLVILSGIISIASSLSLVLISIYLVINTDAYHWVSDAIKSWLRENRKDTEVRTGFERHTQINSHHLQTMGCSIFCHCRLWTLQCHILTYLTFIIGPLCLVSSLLQSSISFSHSCCYWVLCSTNIFYSSPGWSLMLSSSYYFSLCLPCGLFSHFLWVLWQPSSFPSSQDSSWVSRYGSGDKFLPFTPCSCKSLASTKNMKCSEPMKSQERVERSQQLQRKELIRMHQTDIG